MTSSSIILSNILASESCELKTTIDDYMDTKLKEFQEIMKSKVDNIITDKIDKFYNKSFEDHEKILFDTIGSHIIQESNSYVSGQIGSGSKKSYFPLYPLPLTNVNCFLLRLNKPYGNQGDYIRDISLCFSGIIHQMFY